jgi:hypothetical protein
MADTTGTLVLQTGATPTTAVTIGSDQSVTFAGAVSLSGNQTTTGNLTVNGNTTLGDASTDTILMTGAPSIGGAGLGMGMGFRNRIINGAMGIWQRGTSISVGSAAYTYTADRFKAYSANSATTVSQNTSVPSGFQYSLKLQRPNANTGTNSLSSVQMIETANCFDLAGQSITLSFWVKSGANYSGSNLTIQVLSGTVADQTGDPYSWTGLATPINTTQAITTTWTRYSFTGTVSASALELAIAISWIPTGTAGADDSVYITGVQLEKGSTATSFDYRPYGTELALCQRYCCKLDSASNVNTVYAIGEIYNTTLGLATITFPVQMRSSPSITVNSTFQFNIPGGTNYAATGVGINQGSPFTALIQGTIVGASAGSIARLVGVTTSSSLIFSAEL